MQEIAVCHLPPMRSILAWVFLFSCHRAVVYSQWVNPPVCWKSWGEKRLGARTESREQLLPHTEGRDGNKSAILVGMEGDAAG